MKIAVIGAGNGGQAIAGYLSLCGAEVSLFDINKEVIDAIKLKGGILLEGEIKGFGEITCVTHSLAEAVKGAKVIFIVTTSNAHGILAQQLACLLEEEQVIVLSPGRTGGALEFHEKLIKGGFCKKVYLSEAQTLVYACRQKDVGHVNIIGVKDRVLLAAYPASDTEKVIESLTPYYKCFFAAENVLATSLENIGAIFHPSVVMFNAALIERNGMFYFYREMTDGIARFIESLDAERLAVGKAYGIDLISARDWISYAYEGVEGDTLCERMRNNPAYYDIIAPNRIYCRQILEDIPTGLVPIAALGRVGGVDVSISEATSRICCTLLQKDMITQGRSLENMGISGLTIEQIINKIQ